MKKLARMKIEWLQQGKPTGLDAVTDFLLNYGLDARAVNLVMSKLDKEALLFPFFVYLM